MGIEGGRILILDHACLAVGGQAGFLSIQTHSFLTPVFVYDFIFSSPARAESKSWHFLAERQSETAVTLEILFTLLPPDPHSVTFVGHA